MSWQRNMVLGCALLLSSYSYAVDAQTPRFELSPALQSLWTKPKAQTINYQDIDLKSNVWKITQKGQPVSYLLGTYHVGRSNAVTSFEVHDFLKKSKKVVFESPVYWSEDKIASEMTQYFLQMSSPTPLSERMGQEKFDHFVAELSKTEHGKDLASIVNHLQPWAVNFMLLAVPKQGFSHETGVENVLLESARKQKKSFGHLESMGDVMPIFQKMPDDVAIASLNAGTDFSEKYQQSESEVHQLYADGKFDALPRKIQTAGQDMHGLSSEHQNWFQNWLNQDLLIKRNHAWLPKMQKEMKKQSTIFAVGIGHLVSNQGLIALLRERGYTVEPEEKLLIWKK